MPWYVMIRKMLSRWWYHIFHDDHDNRVSEIVSKQYEPSYVQRQRRNIFQLPSGIWIHPQNNFFVIFFLLVLQHHLKKKIFHFSLKFWQTCNLSWDINNLHIFLNKFLRTYVSSYTCMQDKCKTNFLQRYYLYHLHMADVVWS